jgi:DNA repair protein RecN (Recombination protein N)
MIVELSVENLAIIERSDLVLGSGFTVMTGETGAGKSLLIDAVELALGERADVELVRAGAKSALVSAVFDLSDSPDLLARCDELGVGLDDRSLFIQREIFVEGRSQCRIGGRLTPVSVLKQLGQALVDLHGQHDHQSLLFPERHLPFLDQWIGAEALTWLTAVQAAYSETRGIKSRLEALRSDVRNREQKLDLLRYQINEIEEADPKPGEMEESVSRLSRLQNMERLAGAAAAALTALSDGERAAIDLLRQGIESLESSTRYDPELETIAEPIRASLFEIEEGVRNLRVYSDSLEADPTTLEDLASRIETLKRLRRKYGEDEVQVLTFLSDAKSQLAGLEDAEEGEERLQLELEESSRRLAELAQSLSALRKGKARDFSDLVEGQLQDLALERAQFSVEFKEKPVDETGLDDAEFYFSANPGEPIRPLSKIASGGEVSRLMLSIKSVLAGGAGVPTLIFDEVDSGLGGRVAFTLGRKLEQLGYKYQVLVISHLPQVAARAKTHFKIEKVERDGRIVTQVRKLSKAERLEEIARMLGGETITPAALANARDLLGEQGVAAALFD